MADTRPATPSYAAHRPQGEDLLVVDGNLDEQVWRSAARTTRFSQSGSGAVTPFNSRAAMLWDDAHLFIAFWVEEPDVWCTGEIRNGIAWLENTVEVSVAGSGAYYNLSVTPTGQTSELFFVWKDSYLRGGRYDVPEFDLAVRRPMVFGGDAEPRDERGMRWGFLDWRLPGLQTGVKVAGTLNQRGDIDDGWTVELALPWEGLQRVTDDPLTASCGDTWSVSLARNQVIDQRGSRSLVTWTWQPGDEIDDSSYPTHKPDRFPLIELA